MDPDGDNILIKDENSFDSEAGSKASGSEEPPKKKAKKQSRFNGISEEELSKRLLPDLIQPDLDILIVSGIVWNFLDEIKGGGNRKSRSSTFQSMSKCSAQTFQARTPFNFLGQCDRGLKQSETCTNCNLFIYVTDE